MSSNMAAGMEETLDDLIDRATDPSNNESNKVHAERFSNQVNRQFDGPMNAIRLIVGKLQLHQEIISLQALNVLETCVQNCGKKFHQEIGKYRFLNELIKLISPKYDGGITQESVKKRIIELFYSWYIGLPNEGKIAEAYRMLKQQGVIERDPQDPQYKLASYASRPRDTVFEDEEKSKLLASLLKSSNPEDLQAANRLIKTMVKQEEERLEKVSRRIQELETVANNVSLLGDMMENFSPTMPQADLELMKDLYNTCLNMRPQLFRLAGACADDKDDSIADILKASDELTQVIDEYKSKVLNQPTSGQPRKLPNETHPQTAVNNFSGQGRPSSTMENSLLDLAFDANAPASKATTDTQPSDAAALLNDQFKLLGLDSPTTSQPPAPVSQQIAPVTTAGLFTAAPQHTNMQQPTDASQMPMASLYGQTRMGNFHNPQMMGFRANFAHFPDSQGQGSLQQPILSGQRHGIGAGGWGQAGASTMPQRPNLPKAATQQGTTKSEPQKLFDVLDFDVFGSFKNEQKKVAAPAMDQSIPVGNTDPKTGIESQQTEPSSTSTPLVTSNPSPPSTDILLELSTSPPKPAAPQAAPPAAPPAGQEVFMTGVESNFQDSSEPKDSSSADGYSVPPDAIQPINATPINILDKNGIRTVIHMAKDSRPNANPNVSVVVLSTMSTNPSAVQKFSIQAAVPKSMRVKLQPPSGSDLPGYNPLLPPAAITQVMLIANPRKDNIKIRLLFSYQMEGNNFTETANVDHYPTS